MYTSIIMGITLLAIFLYAFYLLTQWAEKDQENYIIPNICNMIERERNQRPVGPIVGQSMIKGLIGENNSLWRLYPAIYQIQQDGLYVELTTGRKSFPWLRKRSCVLPWTRLLMKNRVLPQLFLPLFWMWTEEGHVLEITIDGYDCHLYLPFPLCACPRTLNDAESDRVMTLIMPS